MVISLLSHPSMLVANLLGHSSFQSLYPFTKGLATIPMAAVGAGQISQLLAESTDCSACLLAAPLLCLVNRCTASSQQVGPEPGVEAEEETGGEVVEMEDAVEMQDNEALGLGGDGGAVI